MTAIYLCSKNSNILHDTISPPNNSCPLPLVCRDMPSTKSHNYILIQLKTKLHLTEVKMILTTFDFMWMKMFFASVNTIVLNLLFKLCIHFPVFQDLIQPFLSPLFSIFFFIRWQLKETRAFFPSTIWTQWDTTVFSRHLVFTNVIKTTTTNDNNASATRLTT